MDLATLEKIVPELRDALDGRKFGKIFQLSKFEFAIDLRLAESRYLFISVSPADPRIYLIRRRLKDLERAAIGPSAFANFLRKQVSNALVTRTRQLDGERVIKFLLEGENELGGFYARSLIVQLTGRSANLFLVDEKELILDRLRETRGDGQEIGTKYAPPDRPSRPESNQTQILQLPEGSISEYLDSLDLEKRAADEFLALANAARARLKQKLDRLKRRLAQLEGDLISHGDAERWKHYGDVLLANVAAAKRSGGNFVVIDYFDDKVPEISIPFENDDSVTETAEKYFRKYAKARNAKDEVAGRIAGTNGEIEELNRLGAELDQAIANEDRHFIANFLVTRKRPIESSKKKAPATDGTARSFISSDGFEILVGKKAKDNDVLTFKIAKSLDTWMHAADYPGSHVVIRNPNRKEIPHRTLIEAAELAAFYSQGKTRLKAAVHYTQKKFVNKPKGAAPGLVSLSSFKTLLVEPKVPEALAA